LATRAIAVSIALVADSSGAADETRADCSIQPEAFFRALPPCLVGMEACGTSTGQLLLGLSVALAASSAAKKPSAIGCNSGEPSPGSLRDGAQPIVAGTKMASCIEIHASGHGQGVASWLRTSAAIPHARALGGVSMAEFVIVAATALALASPVSPSPATVQPSAPTVGFHVYPDEASCEKAIAALVTPPGRRLLCLPVERSVVEAANAY
jgi:hypothetical protein